MQKELLGGDANIWWERYWTLKTYVMVNNVYLVNAINFSLIFEIQNDIDLGGKFFKVNLISN